MKPGDRVRIGPSNGGYPIDRARGLVPGNTATIRWVSKTGSRVSIIPHAPTPSGQSTWGWTFAPDELEAVQ